MPETSAIPLPEILAPAGSRPAFLAALAAGADAVYCGLKRHSARMAATNFQVGELARLKRAAEDRGARVYVTLNTLVTSGELDDLAQLLDRLCREVAPDGLIVQDLALIELARQVGYGGEVHLSTLANVSFPAALDLVSARFGAHRVVLPRELSIDEIKTIGRACPETLSLEVFVHGALCYAVSGRCYWSSFLGGKSGLRGRCVQPCRRRYRQDPSEGRFFSCQDVSLDVLAKLLLTVPRVRAWKIEGRKKGAHYVYHVVRAYRLFRDHVGDPAAKKEALSLLDWALGRKGTHYNILSHRPQSPVPANGETGSGMRIGTLKARGRPPVLMPSQPLAAGDRLRIGYEDSPGHHVTRVARSVPRKGRLVLSLPPRVRLSGPTPVFLIDRREPWLETEMAAVAPTPVDAERDRTRRSRRPVTVRLPRPVRSKPERTTELHVFRAPVPRPPKGAIGLWLSDAPFSGGAAARTWWSLPPVLWPDEQDALIERIGRLVDAGARRFLLNAPWQAGLFPRAKGLQLWAGPFCNAANALAIERLAAAGFSGVVISPELGDAETLRLPSESRLPLGMVMSGLWPLCISRAHSPFVESDTLFTSPRGEAAWVHRHGANDWLYPNWPIDRRAERDRIRKAGYRLLVHLHEPIPKGIRLKRRPGKWNWDIGLA